MQAEFDFLNYWSLTDLLPITSSNGCEDNGATRDECSAIKNNIDVTCGEGSQRGVNNNVQNDFNIQDLIDKDVLLNDILARDDFNSNFGDVSNSHGEKNGDTNTESDMTKTGKRKFESLLEPSNKKRKLNDSGGVKIFEGNDWRFFIPRGILLYDEKEKLQFVPIWRFEALIINVRVPPKSKMKIEVIVDDDDTEIEPKIGLLKYCQKKRRKDAKNSLIFGFGEEIERIRLVPCEVNGPKRKVKHYLKVSILNEIDEKIREEFTTVCLERRCHSAKPRITRKSLLKDMETTS